MIYSAKNTKLLILASILAGVLSGCKSGEKNKETGQNKDPLNFVVFFIDDLGYYDVGFRIKKFHTPNIDKLAKESLEFSYAYVPSPTCSPSRVGLYTGIHPAKQEFFRHVPDNVEGEYHQYERDPANLPSRNYLPSEELTYAEALKKLNYNTFFAGKWHLGEGVHGPEYQGFDKYVSGSYGGGSTRKYVQSTVNGLKKEVYTTDLLTDSIVDYIQSYESGRPFLLQVSYWNVHTPTVGRKDLVAFYNERGLEGDEAEFAAQVTSVDESVGKVLDALTEKGFDEHTLVIFTSDQGSFFPNLPLRGTKAVGTALYEGSARVPFLIKWPGVTKPGAKKEDHISTLDVFPTIMDIAGEDPEKYSKLDGLSLTDLIRQDQPLERDYLFLYRAYDPQYAAVLSREGWKLVAYRGKKYELFNINEDISEENNLAEIKPEKSE
ncbi:sulfatase-like hydrolase/transferase [Bacteroidota bacterium]